MNRETIISADHPDSSLFRQVLDCGSLLPLLAMAMSVFLLQSPLATASETIPLDGAWQFQLDRNDVGENERWFEKSLADKINLPGALQSQGFGDDISTNTPWTAGISDRSWFTAPEYAPYRQAGNVKVPFWLQPDKYYKGAAWYQREINVPEAWKGKRIVISLERPHIETRVWLDDHLLGTNNSLSTPHDYDCGTSVAPGKHRLTIRIDNRPVVDVGENSHSISDHTQGNWNGIVGKMEVRAMPLVWIEDLQVYPQIETRLVTVKGRIANASGVSGAGTIQISVGRDSVEPSKLSAKIYQGSTESRPTKTEVSWSAEGGTFETTVPVVDGQLWDEFNPALYRVTVALTKKKERTPSAPARTATFGLREISTAGTQITVNGRKTFIRGTLECCIFPKTGYPPTDVDSWKRIIRICKAHGLNLIRFHSWCPPQAAFTAADELGFYYQVECASWANQSTTIGDGKPVDQWVYEEGERILKAYGNHPSFMLLLYGNEPGGPKHREYLAKWVTHFKERVGGRQLVSSGSGWPQLPENQFHVTPDPRIQGWGAGLKSRINSAPPETTTDYRQYIGKRNVPVISHEIGQWCVYPNFDEIPKYTGPLKAKNFEIFRDSLTANHLADQAHDFLIASGKLQTLCYKEDIESALRTPGMGGFELLDLHDFPGQGTALVGVLDPFWDGKGYVTAAEYSRFCNSTVPLARMSKRVFTMAENFEADVEVAHFGAAPMTNILTTWRIAADNGKTIAGGKLDVRDIPVDNGVALGRISVELKKFAAPARYKLFVTLKETPFENDWDFWIYPPTAGSEEQPQGPSRDIKVFHDWTDECATALDSGEKVLLVIPPGRVRGDRHGRVALGFSSIFWNTAWTLGQPPHTLGILCDPKHLALSAFPTDFHSNWQWWHLISQSQAMILNDMPETLHPIVKVIDDWVTNRRLGLLFEARVGHGKLLVSSIDLDANLDSNPVVRQMRSSLFTYMQSPAFNPSVEITPAQVQQLIAPATGLQKLGARLFKADSEEFANAAQYAIDGDPKTFWHTRYTGEEVPGFSHQITIAFEKPAKVPGLKLLPRQDGNSHGRINGYAVHLSNDGKNWGEPVAEGNLQNNAEWQKIPFRNPQRAKFLRVTALSGFDKNPWTTLAELDILSE